MATPSGRRRVPYKDFLQPALHRRFASTATILLAVSYLSAIFLSDYSYFWSWFPIGPAGVRTLFIFGSGLVVLVLRIAQYHVDIRTANSAFRSFMQDLVRLETYEALVSYFISSLLFCPIFLKAYSDDTALHWIVYRNGDRARLNEKPLFLAFYFTSCAIVQAVSHICKDQDKLNLGEAKGFGKKENKGSGTISQVLAKLPSVASEAAFRALAALLTHLALYHLVFRSFAWGWALFFFRMFYNLPKTNMLPPATPATFHTLKMSISGGFLLFVVWQAANVAFSSFMAREPLKNGKPLTADSRDPNGSLLNGLKSKKATIRAYAMWELSYIGRDFQDRRKAIFEDIDRKDGPMWSQVYSICLEIVKSITTRVDEYGKQPVVPQLETKQEEPKARTTAPPKDEAIFRRQPSNKSMRSEVEHAIDQVARSPGKTPMSRLSPMAKKTWKKAKDSVLTEGQQNAFRPESMAGQFRQLALKVLQNDKIGPFFRQEYGRRLTVAILGTPSAELALYVNAVDVLGSLAVNSLGEDKFGNVHRDVPTIIRTFTNTIRKLDDFRASFPLHWTDVEAKKECPEVDALLDALRSALGKLIVEFEPYRNDLRLTLTDLRLAKEAADAPESQGQAGSEPDMVEVKH